MSKTQKIRTTITFIFLLLFPITLNFFSPYISINGAMNGIISGSILLFIFMFIFSIFFGRAWCGWICPMAALSDVSLKINNKNVNAKKLKIIRYSIFFIWLSIIIIMFILSGGIKSIKPLYMTENIISVDAPVKYIIYYFVLLTFFFLTIIIGKRGACHTICWMSPFLVAGFHVGKFLRIPQLRIKANADNCIQCGLCNKKCPMSINVVKEVKNNSINTSDCILCGECIVACKKDVLHFGIK